MASLFLGHVFVVPHNRLPLFFSITSCGFLLGQPTWSLWTLRTPYNSQVSVQSLPIRHLHRSWLFSFFCDHRLHVSYCVCHLVCFLFVYMLYVPAPAKSRNLSGLLFFSLLMRTSCSNANCWPVDLKSQYNYSALDLNSSSLTILTTPFKLALCAYLVQIRQVGFYSFCSSFLLFFLPLPFLPLLLLLLQVLHSWSDHVYYTIYVRSPPHSQSCPSCLFIFNKVSRSLQLLTLRGLGVSLNDSSPKKEAVSQNWRYRGQGNVFNLASSIKFGIIFGG